MQGCGAARPATARGVQRGVGGGGRRPAEIEIEIVIWRRACLRGSLLELTRLGGVGCAALN